jgi:hypothetical protein
MASIRNQPVVADVGSEELKLLRKSYNSLLDVFGTLLDALSAASAIGDVNTGADAALASVEAANSVTKKIVTTKELADRPKFPASV